jgi:hypothetical protein
MFSPAYPVQSPRSSTSTLHSPRAAYGRQPENRQAEVSDVHRIDPACLADQRN